MFFRSFLALIALSTLGGCPEAEPTVTDSVAVQAVFTDRCLSCHSGEFAPEGMDLTDAYDVIVDVSSNQIGTLSRIEPGDPDSSYLWIKLMNEAAAAGGIDSQMPFDGTAPLSDEELDTIEDWILAGAPR